MRTEDKEGIVIKDKEFFSNCRTKTILNTRECPEALSWTPSGQYFFIIGADIMEVSVGKLFSQTGKRVLSSKHGSSISKVKFIHEESFITMSSSKIKLWDRR